MRPQARRSWEALRRDPPGERFQRHYRRRHEQERGRLIRLRVVGLASVLIGVGVVLLFVPGPGTVLIGLGAALVAEESLAVARALDWTELKLRRLIGREQRGR